jgi:hypothetical protein
MIKGDVLKKYRQAAREMSKHFNTGIYTTWAPERAFIEWYLGARFGNVPSLQIVDGSDDGGIDAILEIRNMTYVFQFKYELTCKVAPIKRGEIAEFASLTKKFADKSMEEEYCAWVDTVRPELRGRYDRVHEKAKVSPKLVRFILVTTKRCEYIGYELLEVEDIQNVAAIWYLYSEGFTPPTERIDLTLHDAWYTSSEKDRYTTYVGIADIKAFLELMKDDDNERLFAQNVRTNLHSKINDFIRKTYEDEADIFWLCNNGVYIVCKKVEIISGNQYRLTFPSVINGSQTLHSISESHKRHSCKVLVRILEMDVVGDQNLLSAVVRRTNTQNTMNPINLCAHDAVQLNIATYLDRFRIFYERREKEWKNERKTLLSQYTPITSKNVAQWLSTADSEVGIGTARSQVAELFEGKNYHRIFGNFGTNFQANSYERLTQLVWAGVFTDLFPRHLSARTKTFAKISRLMVVKAIYECIRQSPALQVSVATMFNEHRFGRRYVPAAVLQALRGIIAAAVTAQKREQRKNPKIDFSNFFKRDELVDTAYATACSPKAISKLTKALLQGSANIQ